MSKLGWMLFSVALFSTALAARAQSTVDPLAPPPNPAPPTSLAPPPASPAQQPPPQFPSTAPPFTPQAPPPSTPAPPFQAPPTQSPPFTPQFQTPAAPSSAPAPFPTGSGAQPIATAQPPQGPPAPAYGAGVSQQPYTRPAPVAAVPPSGAILSLAPSKIVVAVGSEVLMFANMFTPANQPVANQRIDWHLAGPGQFVVGMPQRAPLLNNTSPRIVDAHTATGVTLAADVILTRSTNNPADDLSVRPGQTWIGVTSATEGTSQVTIVAPSLAGPATQTAIVYWADFQWTLPPPANVPVGKPLTLVTNVHRKTNNAPIAGWRVHYEIPATADSGLGPQAAQAVDVTTDDQGRASVDLKSPRAPGSVDVRVQVIRPARKDVPGDQDLLIGSNGVTKVNWYQANNNIVTNIPASPPAAAPGIPSPPPAAPGIPSQPLPLTSAGLNVRVSGPSQSTAGKVETYQINVTNDGDKPVDAATLTFQTPPGATLIETRPQANGVSGGVSWDVGALAVHASRPFAIDLHFDRSGSFKNQATVQTTSGQRSVHSVTTIVGAPPVQVQVQVLQVVGMGDDVNFKITILNRGDKSTGPLKMVDTFDDGFDYVKSPTEVTKKPQQSTLDSISPGQSKSMTLVLRPGRLGTLCNTVEVSDDAGLKIATKACVQVRQAASAVTVNKKGPKQVRVGDQPEYLLEVTNHTAQIIPKLTLAYEYDARLAPTKATSGCSTVGNSLQWTVENVRPNETRQFQMVCAATTAGASVCSRAIATVPGLPPIANQTCVEIDDGSAPPPASGAPTDATTDLEVKMTDRDDPIRIGGATSYLITLINHGKTSVRDVGVTFNVTAGEAIVGTTGPIQGTTSGQNVQFPPIVEIHSGETISLNVNIRADRAGVVHAHVVATSKDLRGPSSADEPTTVLAQ